MLKYLKFNKCNINILICKANNPSINIIKLLPVLIPNPDQSLCFHTHDTSVVLHAYSQKNRDSARRNGRLVLIIRQEVEAGHGCPVDSCPTPVIFMLHHDKLRPLKGRITTILLILSPSHLHGFGTRSSVKPFFGNLSPITWCPHVSMHAEVTVKWRSSSRISIDLTPNFLCYFNNLV